MGGNIHHSRGEIKAAIIMPTLQKLFDRIGLHRTAAHTLYAPHRLMSPVRDWYALLVFLVVLVISLLSLSAYLFIDVSVGDLTQGGISNQVNVNAIDRSLMQETLLFFEGQGKEFNDLRENPPVVSNPF